MRHYEQTFILKATLTKEEIENRIETTKANITNNGGEVIAFQDIGVKKLAYKIDKNPRGYYGVVYFTIKPSAIFELERLLRISEDVLKYLTVKYESKKEVSVFKQMVDKVNGKVEAPKEKEATSTDESQEG